MLTVTAQQSRFHNEAIEDSALKAVVVKDLSISVDQREILSHAELNLQVGKHYTLVGRNGIGKSTLLQAIAAEQIPSIPQSLRVLLVDQMQLSLQQGVHDLHLHPVTVLSQVVASDKERERLTQEEKQLTVAIENVNDPSAAVRAFRRISHQRLEARVEQARRLALRRSGARGAKARKELLKLEEAAVRSQQRIDANCIGASEMAEETTKAADMLAEIQAQLEDMGAAEAEAKARSVLLGLGFSQESIDRPVSELSGGWKTRCSLACVLCQSCDLLLLDEPTNFLDLPSIIWLERYIQALHPTTIVIVVTHDRSFADNITEELLVLRNQTIERFKGNLSTYDAERIKTWKYRTRMGEAQEKQKKHMQSTVDANVKAAKRAGDDKKLKQAASRKKKLDERIGMEVSAKGTRFKLNRDLAGYHLSKRDEIEVPEFDPPVRLVFPTTPADLRFPGPLVAFEKVSFSYGDGKVRRKNEVMKDVDLTIHMGDRVGLAGLNGSGKSTLVSLAIANVEENAASSVGRRPTSGTITRHARARFGLFSQQAVEELSAQVHDRVDVTALSHLLECSSQLQEKDARSLLSGLGIVGRTASDVPISLLSGGQKVRLALAKVLLTPPHLLILDEVTTHLDADTIVALAQALSRFEGALLVVTHDRFFMRCVVEGESVGDFMRGSFTGEGEDGSYHFESDSEDERKEARKVGSVYRLSKGRLTKLEGGMERYEELAAKASSKLEKV